MSKNSQRRYLTLQRDYERSLSVLNNAIEKMQMLITDTQHHYENSTVEEFFDNDSEGALITLADQVWEAMDVVENNYPDVFGTEGWDRDVEVN